MIVYAVELEMAVALRGEFLAWLRGHVAEMLTLPGFTDAEILDRVEPPAPEGRCAISVHYRLHNHAAWQGYLTDHAPRMRAAGLARFGAQVQATRRLLEVL